MKNVFMKVIRRIFSLTIFLFLVLVISHSTIKRSNDKLDELYNNARNYDERKILLHNTSISNANALAKRFNAEVRIANNGTFAVLTLLEGQTVKDIYEAKENNDVLEKLSLDYYARIADIEEEPRQVMPSSYIPSDDLYNQQTYLDYLNLGNTWKDTKGVDTIEVHTTWDDSGATATDEQGKSLEVSVVKNNLDLTKLGTYEITYQAKNSLGKTKEIVRKVTVVDETKPVLVLNSGIDTIILGDLWEDSGVSATDNYDGDLTNKVIVTGVVNINEVGEYIITYKVTDSSGNVATIKRYVNVIED